MNKEYDEQGLPWVEGKRAFMTVAEYAKEHKVARQTVHYYIKNGLVEAKRIGSFWMVFDK